MSPRHIPYVPFYASNDNYFRSCSRAERRKQHKRFHIWDSKLTQVHRAEGTKAW